MRQIVPLWRITPAASRGACRQNGTGPGLHLLEEPGVSLLDALEPSFKFRKQLHDLVYFPVKK
jgi:hypothetical protein